jgi:hypothetical protein
MVRRVRRVRRGDVVGFEYRRWEVGGGEAQVKVKVKVKVVPAVQCSRSY